MQNLIEIIEEKKEELEDSPPQKQNIERDIIHPPLETQKSEIIDRKMTEDDKMIEKIALGR